MSEHHSIGKALHLISFLSAIVPIIAGRKVRGGLWYYILLSFGCDGISYLKLFKNYDHWYGNLFLASEFLLIATYFVQELVSVQNKRLAMFFVWIITLVFLIYSWTLGFWNANYKGGALLYGLMVPIPLLGFLRIIRSDQPLMIIEYPFFIFCAGFFLYVSGNFLIMLFEVPLQHQSKSVVYNLWVVHNILNVIKNLAIAYYFHLNRVKS